MRIFVGIVAGLEIAETLLNCGVDVRLAVAGVAAGVCALALLEERVSQSGDAEGDDQEWFEGEHDFFSGGFQKVNLERTATISRNTSFFAKFGAICFCCGTF